MLKALLLSLSWFCVVLSEQMGNTGPNKMSENVASGDASGNVNSADACSAEIARRMRIDSQQEETAEIPLNVEYREVTPLKTYRLKHGVLSVSRGSVVYFDGDAIVNAANERCLGGGGVDGAISNAGGRELAEARKALPVVDGNRRCRTGDAVITIGGNLNAKYCIHAVGPNYDFYDKDLSKSDEALLGAYKNAMLRARERGLRTIGFSLLSSGIYRGAQSLDVVLRIGIKGIAEMAYEGLQEVHLCAFTSDEADILVGEADKLFTETTEKSSQPAEASNPKAAGNN